MTSQVITLNPPDCPTHKKPLSLKRTGQNILWICWNEGCSYSEHFKGEVPKCPIHKVRMNLRSSYSGDHIGKKFFGCPEYRTSNCRIQIFVETGQSPVKIPTVIKQYVSPRKVLLLEELTGTLQDYRSGKLSAPISPEHIEKWVSQFSPSKHEDILSEINHVFERTYLSKEKIENKLFGLIKHEGLVGPDAKHFWETSHLLEIQRLGESQKHLKALLEKELKARINIQPLQEPKGAKHLIYLDDCIFTGHKIRNDLLPLLRELDQPLIIHVITMAVYKSYLPIKAEIDASAKRSNCKIYWWKFYGYENRQKHQHLSDTLGITDTTDEKTAHTKTGIFGKLFGRSSQANTIFSSNEKKHLLTQEFLIAGNHILSLCKQANENLKPLGFSPYRDNGFGSLFATYRNCPNNAPLAIWWGDPDESGPLSQWYPLLPRQSYSNERTIHLP
jgi:hypothetical protein